MRDGTETKLKYLQDEMRGLAEENQELRSLLKLNKEVIRIQKEVNCSSDERKTSSKRIEENDRGFQSLFNSLYEENASLMKLNEAVVLQRDEARSQALIYQQIYEDALQKNFEANTERQNQLVEMQKQIAEKEQQIQVLSEQIKILVHSKKQKLRIAVSPSEELLMMMNQVEQWRMLVGQQLSVQNQLKQEKQDLQVQLDILRKQLKYDHNLSDQDESPKAKGNDDSSYLDTLPAKVNIQHKGHQVPKLNLSKAMKIQQINIQKQDQIEELEEIEVKTLKLQQQQIQQQKSKAQTPAGNAAVGMFTSPNKLMIQIDTLTENNKVLSKELSVCRQKLQNEILMCKTLEDRFDDLMRSYIELEHVNEILITAQQKYELRWQKIYSSYTRYQDYYLSNGNEPLQTFMSPRSNTDQRLFSEQVYTHKNSQSQQIRELAYSLSKYNYDFTNTKIKRTGKRSLSNN